MIYRLIFTGTQNLVSHTAGNDFVIMKSVDFFDSPVLTCRLKVTYELNQGQNVIVRDIETVRCDGLL